MTQIGIYPEVNCYRYIYDSEAYHATVNNAFQTVLDVTGRGKASVFSPKRNVGESQAIRITVDGNVVINQRFMSTRENNSYFYGTYDFNLSFKFEHRNVGGVNEISIVIPYCVN